MNKSIISTLIIVFTLVFSSSDAVARGGALSGGGDAVVSEFISLGNEVHQMLERSAEPLVSPEFFMEALRRVRVVSAARLYLRGKEVDAINTPSKNLIQISRTRWKDLANFPRNRFVLVAHEYFSVMKLPDRNYELSYKLFGNPGVALVEYSCPVLSESGVSFLNMKTTIYREFVAVQFDDKTAAKIFDNVGSVYAYSLKEINETELTFKGDVMVSVGLYLGLRTIFIPYESNLLDRILSKTKSTDIRSTTVKLAAIDMLGVDPTKWEHSQIACQETRY